MRECETLQDVVGRCLTSGQTCRSERCNEWADKLRRVGQSLAMHDVACLCRTGFTVSDDARHKRVNRGSHDKRHKAQQRARVRVGRHMRVCARGRALSAVCVRVGSGLGGVGGAGLLCPWRQI